MTLSKNIGEFTMTNGGRPGGGPGRWRGLLEGLCAGVLLFLIQWYRWTVSPALTFLFGANSGCRFTPTCSEYAREAVQRHGAVAGSVLAAKRICRCHPFGGCGEDPVPETGKPSSDFCDKEICRVTTAEGVFYQKRRQGRRTPRRKRDANDASKLEGEGFHG